MSDIQEKVKFLKENIYLIIILIAIIFPITYTICDKVNSTRIDNCKDSVESYKIKIEDLESEIEQLEVKKNSFKDIVQSSSLKVNFSELYTPSN